MAVNSFDTRAKTWDADPAKVERAQIVANAIRAALPPAPGRTALEIGCGTGLLSLALQKDFAHISLADTSQGMLDVLSAKIAEARLGHLQPLRLDLANDPLPASRFDVVYSLMVLHHIPATRRILERFHAVLNPGGWLFIADLDAEDGSFHTDGATDIHPGFERTTLQKQVESALFRNIHYKTVFNIHKNGRDYPIFLLAAQNTGENLAP